MEEQLINLYTAKLAKEKGFDIPVFYHYTTNPVNDLEIFVDPDDPQFGNGWILRNYNSSEWSFTKWSICTQSLLQKWLRKKHNIHITVDLIDNTCHYYYDYCIINSNDREYNDLDFIDQAKSYYSKKNYDEYEDALEVGLQEALKMIKND